MSESINNIMSVYQRIVSLVPSQTELLYDLGLDREVIGITKFCIHPTKWFQEKNRIGGTKNINIEKIKKLKPDIVIANKEENLKEDIEKIQQFCYVWLSDIETYSEALHMIEMISTLVGKSENGNILIKQIESEKNKMHSDLKTRKQKVLYFIWKEPFMAVGKNTFIDEMMQLGGFQNVIEDKLRYPILTMEEINDYQPEFIFLSSEPYPFKEIHQLEFQKMFPKAQVHLVDGELFSWYGSRMLKSFNYFSKLHEALS